MTGSTDSSGGRSGRSPPRSASCTTITSKRPPCTSPHAPSLRTSETNYLNEAFSFYAAIRGRSYYRREDRSPHDRSDLMVKKLRYYARFIVVCLLLKKMKLVRDLVRELAKQIGESIL